MTNRILEKEIMNDPEQCLQYLMFNKTKLIKLFCDKIKPFIAKAPQLIFSFGSGTCEYESEIALLNPLVNIDCYEASHEMNKIALNVISLHNLSNNIKLIETHIKEDTEIEKKYTFFMCVNTLHQLHNPDVMWTTIKKACLPNSKFIVLDLLRVEDDLIIEKIIENHAASSGEIFKNDFRASLKSAFTEEEIIKQLLDNGLTATTEVITTFHPELKFILIEGQYGI